MIECGKGVEDDAMTSQNEPPDDGIFDSRTVPGAAGPLMPPGQPALSLSAKPGDGPRAEHDCGESQLGAGWEEQPFDDAAMRLSDTIADFISDFGLNGVAPLARERARLAFIDTLAVMLAGSREQGTEIVCEMVRQEDAAPVVSAVGQSFRTSPQLAALANGVSAHIMDYDMSSMMGQPTSPIIPALLPVAERIGATPAEVAAAFIVGFEVAMRLARAAPEQSSVGGWHAVGTIGTISAATACARLIKAPRKTIADILGIAASLSGGLSANFGTMTKPLHSGTSARNGILATALGRAGFTSSAVALENPVSGYFRAFARGIGVSFAPFADLGRRYDIVERGFKPKRYPCGGLGHTAIDAMLALRREIKVSDVAAIRTGITKHAASRIGQAYPTSVESAKFSMPYVAAYAALYGPPLLKAFTEEAIRDEAVKSLASKVTVAIDPEFAGILDDSPSRVTVNLADGRAVERICYYASGTPQVPLTPEQLEEKFFSCAERAVNMASAKKIFAFLGRIDEEPSFAEFWPLLQRA
jgi:2-methylcitrate dehydratase PrpD